MSDPDEPSLVLFRRAPARLPRPWLKEFARSLRNDVAGGRGFQCLITDDRELRRLNRQFFGINRPTDVLSFPSASDTGFLGEMAVSAQRGVAQAREFGHSALQEMQILMLHGLLHLLGMDHESDGGRMARAEARWRKKLGLPAGLIERGRG